MASTKVSIIIPVYNTEKYLKHCVDSLTSQTLEDIEIILVDDGSRDECRNLCDELAASDARVKVIHKQNEGQGIARNCALEVVCGEYIGFVDSDDFASPEMYYALYDAAKRHDADLVMSGVTFVGGNTFSKEGEVSSKEYFDKETVFENEEATKTILGVVGAKPEEPDDSRYGVGVWKNIYKRTLFTESNIRFVSERKIISEDSIFNVDCLKQCKKVVGIPGAFYCYRRNDESFSKTYKSDKMEKIVIFLNAMEERIKEVFSEDEYGIYLKRLTQGYARILCSQEIMYAKEQKLKYSFLRGRLKRICENAVFSDTLKSYPWYRLPRKQAIFAFAMRYKLYFLQKLLVTLRAR